MPPREFPCRFPSLTCASLKSDTMQEILDLVNYRDKDLRGEGLFIAEGRLLVERSIGSGLAVLGVLADKASAEDARALAPPAIPVVILDGEALNRVAGFPFHRGLLAVVRRPILSPAAVPACGESEPYPSRILILPAITDPGNLGTLLRSALAFGFNTVYLGAQSCDPLNRKALRASMGAALQLSLIAATPASLAALKKNGVVILAAAMEEDALIMGSDAFSRYGIGPSGELSGVYERCALMMGNEHEGIPPEWRERCAGAIRIPVSAAVDSLNVAIAGSILMWELSCRRPL